MTSTEKLKKIIKLIQDNGLELKRCEDYKGYSYAFVIQKNTLSKINSIAKHGNDDGDLSGEPA